MDEQMFNSNLKLLESDLIPVTFPDPAEVSRLVLEAKGEDRTLKDFADVTGISSPTLSRIINGKITRPLSLETVVRIIGNSEKYTLKAMYNLAEACGYMSRKEQSELKAHSMMTKQRSDLFAEIKSMMLIVIIAELVQRGETNDTRLFDSEPDDIPTITDSMIKCDFSMNAEYKEEKFTWSFFTFPQKVEDFNYEKMDAVKLSRNIVKELSPVLLTDAWTPAVYHDYRMTFCFIDEDMYKEFVELMKRGDLNNDFSAILIDMDSKELVEETIFSSRIQRKSPFNMPIIHPINLKKESVADRIGETDSIFVKEDEDTK